MSGSLHLIKEKSNPWGEGNRYPAIKSENDGYLLHYLDARWGAAAGGEGALERGVRGRQERESLREGKDY